MAKKKQKEKKEFVEYIPYELKPDKNFRMNKQVKRMLALGGFKSSQERNSWKKCMISSQLHEEHAKRTTLKREKEDVSA